MYECKNEEKSIDVLRYPLTKVSVQFRSAVSYQNLREFPIISDGGMGSIII